MIFILLKHLLCWQLHCCAENRVHFKNQAIKFSSILCFVNVDFDIIL
jgi:hypothetical protein